jgi:hypothetical protein
MWRYLDILKGATDYEDEILCNRWWQVIVGNPDVVSDI